MSHRSKTKHHAKKIASYKVVAQPISTPLLIYRGETVSFKRREDAEDFMSTRFVEGYRYSLFTVRTGEWANPSNWELQFSKVLSKKAKR